MDPKTKARIFETGGRILGDVVRLGLMRARTPKVEEAPTPPIEPAKSPKPTEKAEKFYPVATMPQVVPETMEEIASGCLPCALGHFSTSSGLLNEAVRFKGKGITSNQVLDRIAGVIEEQNALEREDLSAARIEGLPEWERPIAEEALAQSRELRHKLEGIQSIDELVSAAADTKKYYLKLNRQWYRGRFGHLGTGKAEAIAERVGDT